MCNSTRITDKADRLEGHYNIKAIRGDLEPGKELTYNHANGFSHPLMWIIPQEKNQNMIPIMWGLIPHYIKGKAPEDYYKETVRYGSGLNARSEKLFESNNYKRSGLTRRCIVPVNGFFEPHTTNKNGKDFKIPFYFEPANGPLFNLAGLYAVTPDKMVTFTILTREATPLFAKIHNKKNRRPVIIQDDKIENWLSNDLNENDVYSLINDDLKDDDINAYPISKDLYKRGQGDRTDIIDKVEYQELTIDY